MATYAAFVKKDKLPSTAEITRALSSRGWAVVIDSETTLDALSGPLPIKIDDAPVAISLETSNEIGGEGQAWATVAKLTDVKLAFSADGDAAEWARDLARGIALLTCGAFLADGQSEPIHYGR